MISLGSAGMINQIMSGFVLLYSGSVRTGEYVKVGEIEGTIKEIGILAVKFMTPRKEFITVPNAIVIGNSTTNFSRFSESDGVPVMTQVTIGYDTPWRQVNELLLKAVAATENILQDPAPVIRQTELSDWYPVYSLTFYVRDPHTRLEILSYLNGNIQDAFNEAGVQIMSPHFKDQPDNPVIIPKGNWFTGTPVKIENPDKSKDEA
jgi:small-conductance mechanosensitive channel